MKDAQRSRHGDRQLGAHADPAEIPILLRRQDLGAHELAVARRDQRLDPVLELRRDQGLVRTLEKPILHRLLLCQRREFGASLRLGARDRFKARELRLELRREHAVRPINAKQRLNDAEINHRPESEQDGKRQNPRQRRRMRAHQGGPRLTMRAAISKRSRLLAKSCVTDETNAGSV